MQRNHTAYTCCFTLALLAACCSPQIAWAQLRNLAPVVSPNPYRVGAATEDAPFGVATADLDGDGNLDIVTCDVGTAKVSVLLGNGDGTFKTPAGEYAVGTGPRSVAIADVNGDGIPDIVTANGNSNDVSVLIGNQVPMSMPPKGDGTFLPAVQYPVDAGPVAVAIADVNGDGIPDLVTANTGPSDPITHVLISSSVTVLLGNQVPMSMPPVGDGTFPTRIDKVITPNPPTSLVVADFDGDGKLDVLTANLGKLIVNPPMDPTIADTFAFFKGNGDGTLQDPQRFSGGFLGPRSLVAANVDAGGTLDIIVVYPGARLNPTDPQGVASVMLGNGDGTFQAAHNFPVTEGPVAVAAADFDQDGKLDLLTANLGPRDSTGIPISSTASLLLGNGDGTFHPAQYFPLPVPPMVPYSSVPLAMAIGNFDGDAYPDLAIATAAEFLGPELPTPSIHFRDARVYVTLNIPDTAPTAICQNVTVFTGTDNCVAAVDVTAATVNNGSSDPDFGDTIAFSLSPAGPYGKGIHAVTLTVTDNHGLASTCLATVTVVDNVNPIVSINGNNTINVECHTSFTDPGATASDNCDGDLTSSITVGGSVDVNTPGTYLLTYSVMDSSGNSGSASRNVVVKDTIPPVITLAGSNPIVVECHSTFTDPGATASDTCAGNLTGAILVTGSVDPNTPGKYVLTYKVSDGVNSTQVTRNVSVQDTIAPVVTLNGPAEATIECHTTFTDLGATATDTCAGPQLVNIGGAVDPNTTGDYILTYFATDPSGNVGQATRTVHVVDTTPPVIGPVTVSPTVLSPVNHKLIPVTVSYTATDTCGGVTSWITATSSDPDSGTGGGDIPNDIQIVDAHHLSLRAEKSGKMRTYTITVHCSDGKNEATPKTATVTVGK